MMTPTAEMRLRNAGYRVTKQRAAVYSYLLSTDSHPTVETIHTSVCLQMPQMSLATVYKAVDSLVDVGLVKRIQRGSSSARYDSAVEDHAHNRCLVCDGIWDALPAVLLPSNPTPETFEVVRVNVEYVGYCAPCRREKLGLSPS